MVKPQSAFFERHGSAGVAALERLCADAHARGLLVLLDAKRGDIGTTSQAYAEAYLSDRSPLVIDAMTVTPYLGVGALAPMFEVAAGSGRGLFVVARSSNPEGAPIQDARVEGSVDVVGHVLSEVARANAGVAGLGSVGVVFGATCETSGYDLARVRRADPRARPRRPGRHRRRHRAAVRELHRPGAPGGLSLGVVRRAGRRGDARRHDRSGRRLPGGPAMTDRDWSGYFVAVCGIDGSGKTTQVAVARDYLLATTPNVVVTKQPTDLYRNDPEVRALLDLRRDDTYLTAELALLAAFDRARHIRTRILPSLAADGCVISDRYVYSTYCYFMARGIGDLGWLKAINRLAPEPDLTIYLDVPPEVAAQRVIARDGSSRKREELDITRMTTVRSYFVEQPWGRSDRFHTVDGTAPADVVSAEVLRLLKESDPR